MPEYFKQLFTLFYSAFYTQIFMLYSAEQNFERIKPTTMSYSFPFHLFSMLAMAPCCLSAQTPEPWINLPKAQWPAIALINEVQYKNGDCYIDPSFRYAGTGFLINTGSDTLAATAKHILWIAKNKQSSGVSINAHLQQWVMHPKGNTQQVALMDQLLNEDPTEKLEGAGSSITERDWLVFSIKPASPQLYPLKPRYTPLQAGEKVYIISCPYNDSTTQIHEGIVVQKYGLDIFIDRDPKANMGGSSGSPVIDAKGYLVGVISASTFDNQSNKPVVVAISTEYLAGVLSKKADLNAPKKDYGALILQTAQEKGARAAIRQYQDLIKNPDNYYRYNLWSTSRNGLREAGVKLQEMNKLAEAVQILAFNAKINSGFYLNHNLLAKAQLQAGNKKAAIRSYQISTQKYADEKENEAFKALKELGAN